MGLFRRGASPSSQLQVSGKANGPEVPSRPRLVKSQADDDVTMWNILPSYQLYESTFSKNIDPDVENFNGVPPMYQVTSPSDSVNEYFPDPTRWENSILGNTHRLKQLSQFAPQMADLLKADVHLTSKPGKRGVKPTLFDALEYEFLQGSLIHGYVTFANVGKVPLPYDMVSVVFEGRTIVNDNTDLGKPLVFYKFLNMFDYRASWTPAHLDETVTYGDAIDPVDGTSLVFSWEKHFVPGVVYKKFFNFTIPDQLLDCACEVHDLESHCQILPSIGLDKEVFLNQLRKCREKTPLAVFGGAEKPVPPKLPRIGVKDFSFPDTSISYCVEARVVGKLFAYGGTAEKDEYIMVKEGNAPVRVMPKTIDLVDDQTERFYGKFVEHIHQCVTMGEQVDASIDHIRARRTSEVKGRQLYGGAEVFESGSLPKWETMMPYKRKALMEPVKVVGMLSGSTPQRPYVLQYQPMYKQWNNRPKLESQLSSGSVSLADLHISGSSSLSASGTTMSFPLTLTYTSVDKKNVRPPEIKGLCADIVACTIRSKKYPIPVEFSSSLLVGNGLAPDVFEQRVTQPFRKYLKEVLLLKEKCEPQQFNISNQTVMDIMALANLGVKYNHIKIDKVTAKSTGGLTRWEESKSTPGTFTKHMDVEIDVASIGRDKSQKDDVLNRNVCLVPTFQSCMAGRFYYVEVYVKFSTGEPLPVKLAVTIKN